MQFITFIGFTAFVAILSYWLILLFNNKMNPVPANKQDTLQAKLDFFYET